MMRRPPIFSFFFFNDTATTEIYTLSLHDALPISGELVGPVAVLGELTVDADHDTLGAEAGAEGIDETDRKSTRLNFSHLVISYAVFCLKKKKKENKHPVSHQRHASPVVSTPLCSC